LELLIGVEIVRKSELIGKIQTVLGVIDTDELGVTLPHEHLLVDISPVFKLPDRKVSTKVMAEKPVCHETISWIRFHWLENVDNLRLDDEELVIREVLRFKYEGGDSIVDVTSHGIGRDPRALARMSRATGLNVIMGAGCYTADSSIGSVLRSKSEEELTGEIVKDILVGTDEICSGIIGEIGADSWPLCDEELKSLRATATAQKMTGAAINIHPGRLPESYTQIIKVLDGAGADLSRVVLSHLDRHTYPMELLVEIAEAGCYVEFDMFGKEGYYPRRYGLLEVPNDTERVNRIIWLIKKGFLNKILISQDTCMKMSLSHYGGPGYDHILSNVIPLMRDKGLSQETINTITVENPKRLLTFA